MNRYNRTRGPARRGREARQIDAAMGAVLAASTFCIVQLIIVVAATTLHLVHLL